ncbi:Hypothetical protein VC0266 (sugar utilization related?) [hydrothermal vent metagenome]|uniref:Uracil-DNA glycosylase-like domain-containing protein n=1 Tax=hydrothermal vent metagenome TaxID=652676 RepID=A0A3B0TMR6_9ZZZZ
MSMDILLEKVKNCTRCAQFLPFDPRPVLTASKEARLLIIGQAPGTRVQESGIPWNDKSGERLRDWLAISEQVFYDQNKVALMPMGFCYPGVNQKGGDLPPRPECAPLWHDLLLAQMPQIKLTLLVGQYAQKHYLGPQRDKTLTETVRNFSRYQPRLVPLPHPSWRTIGWQKKNPWFEHELLPPLRQMISELLD